MMSGPPRGAAVALRATSGTPGQRAAQLPSRRYSGRKSWPQALIADGLIPRPEPPGFGPGIPAPPPAAGGWPRRAAAPGPRLETAAGHWPRSGGAGGWREGPCRGTTVQAVPPGSPAPARNWLTLVLASSAPGARSQHQPLAHQGPATWNRGTCPPPGGQHAGSQAASRASTTALGPGRKVTPSRNCFSRTVSGCVQTGLEWIRANPTPESWCVAL